MALAPAASAYDGEEGETLLLLLLLTQLRSTWPTPGMSLDPWRKRSAVKRSLKVMIWKSARSGGESMASNSPILYSLFFPPMLAVRVRILRCGFAKGKI